MTSATGRAFKEVSDTSLLQALLDKINAALPRANKDPAAVLVGAIAAELSSEPREALLKLSVLPAVFTGAAAACVLGVNDPTGAHDTLLALQQTGLLRANPAAASFGLPPLVRSALQASTRRTPDAFETAATGLVQHCLQLADTAAAYNVSNAQVAFQPVTVS